MTLPPAQEGQTPAPSQTVLKRRDRPRWAYFPISILLFLLSLMLVKEGARPVGSIIRSAVSPDNPLSALGFGWVFAIVVLSGSPVAAVALAFLDAGILTSTETFSMVAGSRLGAAYIVLFLGFLYTLRDRELETSGNAGLLSLLVTQTIYLPALAIGYLLLASEWLQRVHIASTGSTISLFDRVLAPGLDAASSVIPVWAYFPIGLLIMLASFWLFDQALPEVRLEPTGLARINRLLFRPLVSFLLGAGLTALTMSVSVSLGLLVPLSSRGFMRQENAIPYIMGANITTFIDTLIAGALLANPAATTIVLVQMLSVGIVSLLIMLVGFGYYERLVSWMMEIISVSRWRMLAYLIATVAIPVVLMLVS